MKQLRYYTIYRWVHKTDLAMCALPGAPFPFLLDRFCVCDHVGHAEQRLHDEVLKGPDSSLCIYQTMIISNQYFLN